MRVELATLLVRDADEAVAWFTGVVGLPLVADDPLPGGGRWTVVGSLLLAVASTPEQLARVGDQTGGRVGFFVRSDDFAADHARLVAAGVDFLEQPRHEAYGSVAVFRDLYGNRWDLLG